VSLQVTRFSCPVPVSSCPRGFGRLAGGHQTTGASGVSMPSPSRQGTRSNLHPVPASSPRTYGAPASRGDEQIRAWVGSCPPCIAARGAVPTLCPSPMAHSVAEGCETPSRRGGRGATTSRAIGHRPCPPGRRAPPGDGRTASANGRTARGGTAGEHVALLA
jgi:hypothetical protein